MLSPTSTPPAPASSDRSWRRSERPADSDARVLDLGRLLVGVVVVTLGLLFLLDSAGVLNAGHAIERWWPLVIVAAGVIALAQRPRSVLRGMILTVAGGVLLLFSTDVLKEDAWSYVWPAAIILAGLVIVARWTGRIPTGVSEDDVVRSTAVFGGTKLLSHAQQFRGAWLTAIFGGITLDLRDALPIPDGATVNATAAFGGVDILVPKGWRITVRSTPIFGGVEDETDHTTAPAAGAPTLRVDAVTILGGVAIKHEA
jgi:predicted membrane protein